MQYRIKNKHTFSYNSFASKCETSRFQDIYCISSLVDDRYLNFHGCESELQSHNTCTMLSSITKISKCDHSIIIDF